MEAEIVTDTDKVDPIMERLLELGFELEIIDWPEDLGTTIVATTLTELEEVAFFHYVGEIVDPLDADLMEAGIVWQPSLLRGPSVRRRRVLRF
jgi:hypothetical protein